MSDDPGRGVWRVWARDESTHEHGFDALVVFHDATPQARWQRHVALPIPYEEELPDVPLTLIVRARPSSPALFVEYKGFAPDGSLRIVGRSAHPLAVIVRSASGILVTGLPEGSPEPLAPAT
jgi:hypothetical protein